MLAIWIGLGAAVLVLAVVVATYNALLFSRMRSESAWSRLRTLLKRRHDLVEPLLEALVEHGAQEPSRLESSRAARARAADAADPATARRAESALVNHLNRVLSLAGADRIADLQGLLSELEALEVEITAARALYDATVHEFNARIEAPTNTFVAKFFGLERLETFEIPTTPRRTGSPTAPRL